MGNKTSNKNKNNSYRILYGTMSFIAGSVTLSICSTFQKLYVGNPIVLKAYTIPIWLGGFVGILFGMWHLRLKQYAYELEKANKELESLDQMKNNFLSNISHEIKTPLVSIQGYSELMKDGTLGQLNEKQDKATGTIIRNSKRLNRLLDSILYMSMKQDEKIEYVFNPVNIDETISHTVSDMLQQSTTKGITIVQDVADDLPLINGDVDKLNLVFFNLIDNSIKFTQNGGKINIAANREDDNIHISISDTGIGIPKHIIPTLFQKFYQVDASTTRKYGGIGVGMYISKLIIDAHGGKIWAESEENVSSTIHIILPK